MWILVKDGRAHEISDHRDGIIADLDDLVVRWEDDSSGWSADGSFWRVCEIPDVPEYQPFR
jgi:hypothetical protein